MAKKLEAVGINVILEVNLNQEKKSEGGLFIPSNADKESKSQATVVTVGEKVTTVKAGDKVIISRTGGEVFELDGKHYYALREEDIFCIIREEV